MNACDICGENFPNITELYKHKHKHNHINNQSLALVPFKGKQVVPFKKRQDKEDFPSETRLDVTPYANKRNRDLDSDSDSNYRPKRYRYDSDLDAVEYKKSMTGMDLVPYTKPRKKKPKRKFIAPKSDEESELADKRIQIYKERLETYQDELLDQKQKYEKKLERVKDENEKFKKQCEEHISNKEKEVLDMQSKCKKELEEQEDSHRRIVTEMETHYQNQIKIFSEKIKSMEEDDATFKPLSDAIFNCITIEEIFKIKKLVRNREFEELIEKHLDTLQKLFLSLSYGVIPICQPQRDIISDSQKKLIAKIETSTPSKAKSLIMQNRSDIVNIFEIIDQSLELATTSYDRFRRL